MGRKIFLFFSALMLSVMVLVPSVAYAENPNTLTLDEFETLPVGQRLFSDHLTVFADFQDPRLEILSDERGDPKKPRVIFGIAEVKSNGKCKKPSNHAIIDPYNINVDGFTHTASFNTTGLEGEYCVGVTYNASNVWDAIIRVTFDNTAPRAPRLLTPPTPAVVNGAIITQTWTPISDADHYIYESYRDPFATVLRYRNTYNTPYKTAFNVPEGTYWWRVKAVDAAGNESIWSDFVPNLWRITVDNTPPATPTGLTILDHEGTDLGCFGYTNNRRITVDWNDNTEPDLSHYQYDVKDRMNLAYPTVSHYTGNIRDIDGAYKYRVRAVDSVGNTSPSTEWCYVTLDRVGPEVSLYGLRHIDKNLNNVDTTKVITNDNTPIVLITASDVSSAVSEVYVNGVSATFDGTYWVAQLVTPLPEGSNTLTVRAVDMAGNETIINPSIFIDTKAPTATFQHYIDGDLFTGEIAYVNNVGQLTFTGEYTDATPSSGLYTDSFVIFEAQDDGTFRFSANGKKAFCSWRTLPNMLMLSGVTFSQTTPVDFSLCTTTLPDGEYYMAHHIYDNATRKDIPTINQFRDVLGLHFIVDSEAPETEITNPMDGDYVRGAVDFRGTITDDALLRYYYKIDGTQYVTSKVVYSDVSLIDQTVYTWDTTLNNDGVYTMHLAARDKALNRDSGSEDSITVTVDNTIPEVLGISDQVFDEGDIFPTDITTTATDNMMLNELCYTASNPYFGSTSDCITQTIPSNTWDINISNMILDGISTYIGSPVTVADTSIIPEGDYTFSYKVSDQAGNESLEQSFIVTINNVPPQLTLAATSYNIAEGDSTNIIALFSDPSDTGTNTPDDSSWNYTLTTGDGTTYTGTMANEGVIFSSLAHTYTTEGVYTVDLEVCEATDPGENECRTESIDITVNNEQPLVTVTPPAPSVGVGDALVLSASTTNGNPPYTYAWSGACSGTASTATVDTTTAGTLICTVTVTDNDSDTSSASTTVTVEAPEVLAAVIAPPAGDATPPEEEPEGGIGGPDEAEVLGEITDGDVMGAQTCEISKKLFGYIYVDKNDNNKKDDKEQVFAEIPLTIYYEDNNGKVTVRELTTDINGYWETTICPGMYKIEIDKTNLPKNFDTEFGDVLSVTVPESSDEVQADIFIEDNRNFWQKNWPWIILGIAALLVIILLLADRRRNEDE